MNPLAQCRAKRQIPIASRRCRQRQRRSEVNSTALVVGGIERALNFDDSCAKRQIPGCARLIAAEAADLAYREDPLDLKNGQARPNPPGLRFHS